jgi:hypothetical protein
VGWAGVWGGGGGVNKPPPTAGFRIDSGLLLMITFP